MHSYLCPPATYYSSETNWSYSSFPHLLFCISSLFSLPLLSCSNTGWRAAAFHVPKKGLARVWLRSLPIPLRRAVWWPPRRITCKAKGGWSGGRLMEVNNKNISFAWFLQRYLVHGCFSRSTKFSGSEITVALVNGSRNACRSILEKEEEQATHEMRRAPCFVGPSTGGRSFLSLYRRATQRSLVPFICLSGATVFSCWWCHCLETMRNTVIVFCCGTSVSLGTCMILFCTFFVGSQSY